MASTDAKPVPQKNVAFRVTFPILDADGDLVTGAASLDSEVSKDGGAFTDCTNEATEIATSSGVYYLDLTSTEMNADTVAVIVKTATSGAKTTTIVMYPEETGDIRVNVTAYGGTAGTFASGRPEVNTTHAAGTAWGSGAITAAAIATDAITSAKVADGAITAAKIATGAIDADAIAADAVTEIQSGLATAAALSTVAGYIDTEITDIQNRLPAALVSGRMDSSVGAMAANTVTASAVAADALAEINAEVVDALATDTYAEPGQGSPAATASLAAKINYLYKAWRNKVTQDTGTYKLFADDAATVDQKATVSDDGSTFTRGEIASGP